MNRSFAFLYVAAIVVPVLTASTARPCPDTDPVVGAPGSDAPEEGAGGEDDADKSDIAAEESDGSGGVPVIPRSLCAEAQTCLAGCPGTCAATCTSILGCVDGCQDRCEANCGGECSLSACERQCAGTCTGGCSEQCAGFRAPAVCMALCQLSCPATCESRCVPPCLLCENACETSCRARCAGSPSLACVPLCRMACGPGGGTPFHTGPSASPVVW